jgi:hypothetical protein
LNARLIELCAISTMHSTLRLLLTILLWCSWEAANSASAQESAPKQFAAEAGRTAKERLSSKSADEQRVDNCKVPIELRGPKPRPDRCAGNVSTGSKD